MYFPIGWPRILHIPQNDRKDIRNIVCNRDRLLYACVTEDSIGIWYVKPCVVIVSHQRSKDSLEELGVNLSAVWKSDSTSLAVVTSRGHICFYNVDLDKSKAQSLFSQSDSKVQSLQRESAELFIKGNIPPIFLTPSFNIKVPGGITRVINTRDELVVATETGQIERYQWDGRIKLEYCLELAQIPFSADQQYSRAIPLEENNVYVSDLEYSPILGGFAIVLSDGRAALLTTPSLSFELNQVKGLWAQDVTDATCTAVNHKYLLIAYGKQDGEIAVCQIDEVTGGLQISHKLLLSSKDYPDASSVGPVKFARWTPDGCALLVAWQRGGFGMWSVYGALLLCSLGWDYGITQDLKRNNPLLIDSVEWGMEGYQLWMSLSQYPKRLNRVNNLAQMQFVKSALTVNPCVSNQGHLVLQSEDRLYINCGRPVAEIWKQRIRSTATFYEEGIQMDGEDSGPFLYPPNSLLANKQWIVIMIPSAYNSTNWPIRYVALDKNGKNAAIAGRTGVAHCCLQTKRWKLFGNETQEKDFVVTGSLMWWQDHLVMGCYNIQEDRDEIRLYPRDSKLDNSFAKIKKVPSQVLLLNVHRNRLVAFCADSHIGVYTFSGVREAHSSTIHLIKEQDIDVSNLCVHPVCMSHVILVSSRAEGPHGRLSGREIQSVLVNVCGRVVMFQLTLSENTQNNGGASRTQPPLYVNPTVLASNVESVWVSENFSSDRKHLVESILFGCGAQGMKVWLPLFLRDGEKPHNFMSKWIMLPLSVNIYPLTVLFEDAVILGVENDTVLYPAEPTRLNVTLPFSVVGRTSQVYLHHILRQLLRRNLGFHAWEIARSCMDLPYFPHSLELLLHEVLEEEAMSKEPIPDALLPRVVEFIREFPVYLQTIVQCARKIEIALWPYLFTTVGQPHNLFQECLQHNELATGASYLIILQNLEPSSISRQYATKLLDAALDQGEWNLCKDLVRFLKAIDPSDVESPPRAGLAPTSSAKYPLIHPTPPLSPNDEEISFVLGTMQVPRTRTLSIGSVPKMTEYPGRATHHKDLLRRGVESKGVPICGKPAANKDVNSPPEEFFLDVILQRHARKLLSGGRLRDLGCFAAHLDFHLVTWLRKERSRAARVEEYVLGLKKLHLDFQWPYPIPPQASYLLQRKDSEVSTKSLSSCLSTLEDSLQCLNIDQERRSSSTGREEIRDSGYLSHSDFITRPTANSFRSDMFLGQTHEAQLRPHTVGEDESVRTLDLSEDSSLWGEGDQSVLDDGAWNGLTLSSDIEQMSAELASKGPPQSEVQLRYLLQLMMESTCLDWAVLISVILRDAMAVIRIVNAARASDVPQDSTSRLKEGLACLERWADRECFGYKRFMHTIRNQSMALSKITCSKLRIRSPSPNAYMDMDTPPSSSGDPPDLEAELMAMNDKEYESRDMDDEADAGSSRGQVCEQGPPYHHCHHHHQQQQQQPGQQRKETHGTECVIS